MLGWLLRLPAIAYFVIAGLLVVGGTTMFFSMRADDSARAAALRHAPPAVVTLDQLKPATYKADYDEIVLKAQAFPQGIIESVRTKRSAEVGRTLYMPLFPLTAKSPDELATAVIVIEGNVSDEQIGAMFVEAGNFGPVAQVDGLFEGVSSSERSNAMEALGRSVKLSPDFAIIKPFIHGRKADLAPKGDGPGMLIAALIAAIVSLGFGFYRKESEPNYGDRPDGYQS
jgi:hypothetical protein